MPRLLYFCPKPPLPIAGAPQRRYLSLLRGFADLGYENTLAFIRGPGDPPPASDQLEDYRKWGVRAVESYEYRPARDLRVGAMIWRAHRLWSRQARVSLSLAFSPWARGWLRRLTRRVRPDVFVSSYVLWDWLVDSRETRRPVRVMDSIDLLTSQQKLWRAVSAHITTMDGKQVVRPDGLADDFLTRVDLTPEPFEFAIYDRYQHTIAISPTEAAAIRAGTRRTAVHYIPMTMDPQPDAGNDYSGPVLFPMAHHPLTVQGYAYLTQRVLPAARAAAPDLRVRVIGPGCKVAPPADGVELAGFVSDLSAEYNRARFAINPIMGGTGQPIKVVEAMAHGLPVVILRWAEAASPVRHGESGFVADTAEEFAGYVARLWNDPALCRRLGAAARETVRTELSRDRLTDALARVVGQSMEGEP